MNEENVARNGLKAWLLASRPKTLTGAAVPVMIALALAWRDTILDGKPFLWVPAVLCLLFAFIMQVDANFVNDYFDFKHGNDDESRLGPKRACSMGWVSERAMKHALVVVTLLGALIGLPLVYYGGWPMVLVGVACVVFCFLYTTVLSYLGLGDVLVLVFFGLVPVCFTYYLQMQVVKWEVVTSALACGLVIDCLLIINNYRDIDNDKRSGKRTLIVMVGKRAGRCLYLACGLLGVALAVWSMSTLVGAKWLLSIWLVYLLLHFSAYREMKRIDNGRELNSVLGMTARNIFVYGLTFVLVLLIDLGIS